MTDSPGSDLADAVEEAVRAADDPAAVIAAVRARLHALSLTREHPVDLIRWVPLDLVHPNDYNPNQVAKVEMSLLATSIRHDGYTQPVVTVEDGEGGYVIVDGFHRYWTMRADAGIRESTGGLLPIVVIDKPLSDRMASTVRHNRARGRHTVDGLAGMIFRMLEEGMTDAEICTELGMEPEELLRLKHVTGFSRLWEGTEYRRAWQSRRQARIHAAYAAEHGDGFVYQES